MRILIDDDMCRCGAICTCGGDDWGEEYDTLQAEHNAAVDWEAVERQEAAHGD